MANKKGYTFPTNPDDYLNFIDANNVSEDAREEIALAVREGLIDQGGFVGARASNYTT